jgi:hypothetical protein
MRSTRATIQQRVEELLTIRLQGAEFADLRQYAAEKGWNCSDRQLYRYIDRSDELLARTLETDRQKLLNRHHATRRALLARALQVGDIRTALAVAQDEAKLLGLYPPTKHQLTGKDGGPLEYRDLSTDQRRAELVGLLDMLRQRGGIAPPSAAADPTAGPAAGSPLEGGPGPHHDVGGHGPGPMANGAAPLPL